MHSFTPLCNTVWSFSLFLDYLFIIRLPLLKGGSHKNHTIGLLYCVYRPLRIAVGAQGNIREMREGVDGDLHCEYRMKNVPGRARRQRKSLTRWRLQTTVRRREKEEEDCLVAKWARNINRQFMKYKNQNISLAYEKTHHPTGCWRNPKENKEHANRQQLKLTKCLRRSSPEGAILLQFSTISRGK